MALLQLKIVPVEVTLADEPIMESLQQAIEKFSFANPKILLQAFINKFSVPVANTEPEIMEAKFEDKVNADWVIESVKTKVWNASCKLTKKDWYLTCYDNGNISQVTRTWSKDNRVSNFFPIATVNTDNTFTIVNQVLLDSFK